MTEISKELLEYTPYLSDEATLQSFDLFDENGVYVTDSKILEKTKKNIESLCPSLSEWVYAYNFTGCPPNVRFLLNTKTGLGYPLDENGKSLTDNEIYFNTESEFCIDTAEPSAVEDIFKKDNKPQEVIENPTIYNGEDGLLF